MRKLQRFAGMLLTISVLLNTLTPFACAAGSMNNFTPRSTYTAGQFSDVKPTDWFSGNVQTVCEMGLMNGKGSGIFDPNGNVTLAELITITARLHSIYHTGTDSFPAGDPWYRPYYDYCDQQDILPLYSGSVFNPTVRSQVVAFLYNALPREELPQINSIADNAIPDVSIYGNGADAIYHFYRAGIMTGSDAQGTFNPSSFVKRCEVAAVVGRLIDPTQRKAITLEAKPRPTVSGTCSSFDINMPGQDRFYVLGRHESACTWTLTADGTLTISGNGPMAATYSTEGGPDSIVKDNRPWRDYVKDIKKVVVNEGVTTITQKSFMFCTNLTEIRLPESVHTIGTDFIFGCTALKTLEMPSKLTKLDGFGANVGLTHLEIPEGVETLPISTCTNSPDVQSITLPSTLKTVIKHAFSKCSFSVLKIPASVTYLGSMAFSQPSSDPIKEVYFYGDLPEWKSNAIGNWHLSGTNFPADKQPILYFIEGKAGWTTPTWTAPDGTVYQTRTFDPTVVPYND